MRSGITVAIPTIPPRMNKDGLFYEAINSVTNQTVLPDAVSVSIDNEHMGAAHNRQRALDAVKTKWVAFLDDDDYWYENHIETLLNLAEEHNADFVWSWFDGNNPFPMHRGRQMNPAEPHHTTMTVMVKTELAQTISFLGPDMHQDWSGEDWRFILGCVASGAKFAHTPDVTWHYRVHGGNTSGLSTRW